jgi:PIN domain nuclease of toxin-antitoxin system
MRRYPKLSSKSLKGDKIAELPSIHRDPFDRMLICQAMEHNLVIATVDDIFQAYTISLLKSV